MIRKGSLIKIHYSVEHDGNIVETTQKRGPFSYVQGQDQFLLSIQKQLEGRRSGEQVSFTLEPEEAYGLYKKEAEEEIPKSEVPQWAQLKPGMYLQEKQDDGRLKVGQVVEIGEGFVRLSFNHPMAGKRLKYNVQIIDVINLETKESL